MLTVQVTSATFLPILVSPSDRAYSERNVLDEYFDDLAVAYSVGPPYGERLITWADLERIDLSRRDLRRRAANNLDSMLDTVRIHGQPPALMLSFQGLESSLVLADPFWDSLEGSVPGELVIGVPARDVVIMTGSASQAGIAKARRAVDRVFFAGGPHLLVQELLVRRRGDWEVY
ncbi:hypothetical protein Raf01_84920 [Rugosimonospora africana]|uniref:Uncharacterized protein n=1 Tax=Rugosimonospora africana TaxID=556532 RepID=A0A8J3VVI9_9ACTN|nr:hypothetical protein Raf01_84920 [Rugosimonospora africana]